MIESKFKRNLTLVLFLVAVAAALKAIGLFFSFIGLIPSLLVIALTVYLLLFSPRARRINEEQERINSEKHSKAARSAWELAQWERKHRDSDAQIISLSYEIGRHAAETLALRYGIPHIEKEGKNRGRPLRKIEIRKIEKVGLDKFLCELPEYNKRNVVAIIEKDAGYVKTFYPLDEEIWFRENSKWEEGLKGNAGFSIKEMARMHFDRINRALG